MADKGLEKRYAKGEQLEVAITDIGNDGEGIGKVDGYTLFVKDAVIGDVVRASIMKAKKNYAYAHLDEVVSASPDRIEPKCAVARQCGGCQIQNMSYESQLRFKASKVRNNIVRLGGFAPEEVDSIMQEIGGMEEPFRYRNKAQFPIGTDKNGNPIAGFYAGHTHAIIPATECMIGTAENKKILEIILGHMKENGISAYNEETGKGLVRHVLIRKGFNSGEVMVSLVLNFHASKARAAEAQASGSKENSKDQTLSSKWNYIRNQDKLVEKLAAIDGMTSISVNLNTEKTNVILGKEVYTIWGSDTITDTLCGLQFHISPLSFYQVNPVQAQKLYEQAIQYADLKGSENVWDLYCGIGTITLAMSKKAGHVYGVEVISEAIEDARANAEENGITNADFYVGKAEEVLPDKFEKENIQADVIVVDPPRKGCDENCLATMLKMQPQRIVYVSCDSATLARDLRILCDGGYKLAAVRPFDLFPQTVHVETVCLLSKLHEAKHHVHVSVDMDELDLTTAEAKATYDEIRDWVQEKYGFHVSNLNIAKVKQKHGIIERENYNKPKSENSKQPGCPEEKIKAIEDAMKHFKMI